MRSKEKALHASSDKKNPICSSSEQSITIFESPRQHLPPAADLHEKDQCTFGEAPIETQNNTVEESRRGTR